MMNFAEMEKFVEDGGIPTTEEILETWETEIARSPSRTIEFQSPDPQREFRENQERRLKIHQALRDAGWTELGRRQVDDE